MSSQFPFLTYDHNAFRESEIIQQLNNGSYKSILTRPVARLLFQEDEHRKPNSWTEHLSYNIQHIITERANKETLFLIGLAAFQAFLQSNVTGPPIDFRPQEICFPHLTGDALKRRREELISRLTVDGEAIYALMPQIELFLLAQVLLNEENIYPTPDSGYWARLRVNFWHQRMLNEAASTLQDSLYKDLAYLEGYIFEAGSAYGEDSKALFLLERAAIHMHHGFDKKARDDIDKASTLRRFRYVLTGRLGKRTKFQQNDLSQLVVLAKSCEKASSEPLVSQSGGESSTERPLDINKSIPKGIKLDDDTVLERISFASKKKEEEHVEKELPASLAELDPGSQPLLDPIDATILLSFASSITNTAPDHGLTREETAPYASRVIEGGSSNWQVYTQALLVRSRIEGFKARTVERGVLQLQALVDQVIAETTGNVTAMASEASETTTFLPRAKPSESAPVFERLKFIFQLNTPPRWAMEAELASRWAALGALRTALEIFERLELWAEASLCLAATDEETKAIRMVRKQLYQPSKNTSFGEDIASETYNGPERSPLPADAPRLFCILGDLETDPVHWERAWTISNQRYSRAQRSLGKYYVKTRRLPEAAEAYAKSLASNPQNATTWFAVGCVRLELEDWRGAVNAFQRCVHLEPEDAEAWSNLAASLVHLPPEESAAGAVLSPTVHSDELELELEDKDATSAVKADPLEHSREAFLAFKRAANLKRDSFRIWQNIMAVGAKLVPPPYSDLIIAQTRLIDLRGSTEGESCVDVEILEGILQHIIATSGETTTNGQDTQRQPKHGISRMYAELLRNRVIPLITHSRRLWQLTARFEIYDGKPGKALEAYEKAWRITLNQPGWDDGSGASSISNASKHSKGRSPGNKHDEAWQAVLDATDELVSAYESLGEREAVEGMKAGSGELVCKNWRFKARSAIRSVVGRRIKAGMEGDDVEDLRMKMEGLKE